MGIANPPADFGQAYNFARAFQRQHLKYSDAGQLMDSAQVIVVQELRRPLKRFGPAVTSALFEQQVLRSLGLPDPSQALARSIDLIYVARNAKSRMDSAPQAPWFLPGRRAGAVYPQGYDLHHLGPQA